MHGFDHGKWKEGMGGRRQLERSVLMTEYFATETLSFCEARAWAGWASGACL